MMRLLLYWARCSRIECITGHGDPDSVYLVRYHLINNRFMKLYLHYFLRSDPDNPHDHPWDFWTFMVRGAYTEDLYDWRTRAFTETRRTTSQSRFIKRKADSVHRIRVDKAYDLNDRTDNWKQAPMTLFFALGKYREWGFVNDYATGPRWEHHASYLKRANKL